MTDKDRQTHMQTHTRNFIICLICYMLGLIAMGQSRRSSSGLLQLFVLSSASPKD